MKTLKHLTTDAELQAFADGFCRTIAEKSAGRVKGNIPLEYLRASKVMGVVDGAEVVAGYVLGTRAPYRLFDFVPPEAREKLAPPPGATWDDFVEITCVWRRPGVSPVFMAARVWPRVMSGAIGTGKRYILGHNQNPRLDALYDDRTRVTLYQGPSMIGLPSRLAAFETKGLIGRALLKCVGHTVRRALRRDAPARPRRPRSRLLVAAMVLTLAASSTWAFQRLRPLPAAGPGDCAKGAVAFTESDLGAVAYNSLPRAVWEAIPVLFPEILPEGWGGVGVLTNPDRPKGPPLGWVSSRLLGVEMYASNCSLCHVGTFQGKVVLGAPNQDLDIQYLVWAIGSALRSEKLSFESVDRVASDSGHPLEGVERQGVRLWILAAKQKLSSKPLLPYSGNPGAGRSDNLNGFKRIFGLPAKTPAYVDLVNVFNQRLKKKSLIDGSMMGDTSARVMLSELQKGRPGRDALLHREVFDDINAYLERELQPPKFPFAVDAKVAERGHGIYAESCARCHGTYAPDAPSYPNLQISTFKVGTDPERARSMTPDIVAALETSDFRGFLHMEGTDAYMPPPLSGVWVTGPYLHNGSVPTLWHLLHPEERPAVFYRRFNDFDPERVGLVCVPAPGGECAPDAKQAAHDPRTLTRFDVSVRGNSNKGHLYGDDLAEDEKAALIEYLKTI